MAKVVTELKTDEDVQKRIASAGFQQTGEVICEKDDLCWMQRFKKGEFDDGYCLIEYAKNEDTEGFLKVMFKPQHAVIPDDLPRHTNLAEILHIDETDHLIYAVTTFPRHKQSTLHGEMKKWKACHPLESDSIQNIMSYMRKIFRSVANGLAHLHKAVYAHRNLSSTYILVHSRNHAMVTGYSLRRDDQQEVEMQNVESTIRASRKSYPLYELSHDGQPIDHFKDDVFALGAIMLQTLSIEYSHTDDTEVIHELLTSTLPIYYSNLSDRICRIMSEHDEDDYMSEEFIKSLEKNDVKPGLTFDRGHKRKHELEAKKKQLDPKKRNVTESEARTSGLEKPIEKSNKGFQMLQKMGFKAEDGMKKPITIEVKSGRSGLGMESATVEKLLDIESGRLEKFKQKTILTVTERFMIKDLKSSQKSCFNLDSNLSIELPVEKYFWPTKVLKEIEAKEKEVENAEQEEDEDLVDTSKKLEVVTSYLRNFHKFCLWCGIKFDSSEDMERNCPGNDREAHSDLL